MPKVTVGHHPELTSEDAMSIFERHFGNKYEVIASGWFATSKDDFVVRKNAWIGVVVTLRQKRNETAFGLVGHMPSQLAHSLSCVAVLLLLPLFLPLWVVHHYLVLKGITNEVRAFIETAEEFR